jgi:hypothetical protein
MKSRMSADFLVRRLLHEETATVMVRDSGGAIKNQFAVPNPQDLAQIEKLIDDNGGIPFGSAEEEAIVSKASPENNLAGVRRWINRSEFSDIKQDLVNILTQAIHEEPNEVFGLFSSIADLSSLVAKRDNQYGQKFLKRLSIIKMSPRQRSMSTGEGEIAIAFLCGTVPAQKPDYDIVQNGKEYSVKSNSTNISLYRQDIKSNLKSDEEFKRLSPAKKAVKVLGLTSKGTAKRTRKARMRYAIVCRTTSEFFEFRVFSLSNRVNAELDAESRGVINTTPRESQIWTDPSLSNLYIRESKIASKIISELSRRDQEQVTAIARRIAQEVLEDELGDDFDKAVRREMVASFKDGEVEDGIADISKEYMRKFYRSLGVGTSPLDKVKI